MHTKFKPFRYLLALGLICACPFANAFWVEDFKSAPFGMDHGWSKPQVHWGHGTVRFESDGENARLAFDTNQGFRCFVETAYDIDWQPGSSRYIQIRYSSLSPEARFKVYARCDADNRMLHLVANEKSSTTATAARLLTIDLKDQIPAATRHLGLRLELDRDNREQALPVTEIYLDWIKVGMAGREPPPAAPALGGQTYDSATRKNRLTWQASAAAHPLYTLSLSRDPSFAALTTTQLDAIQGTDFETSSGLAEGKWYWTVSATSPEGLSSGFAVDSVTSGVGTFTVAQSSPAPTEFAHFSVRAGSQGFGSIKKFTSEPKLVEQARLMLALGSDAYKFLLGADADRANYVSVYQDLSTHTRIRSHSLVELIKNEPAYKTVFDMPFTYFVMWVQPMDMSVRLGEHAYNAREQKQEYQQLYDLTRYFMQTYQGTGKVFLIGHWEGDNMLMEDGDFQTGVPSELKLADMRAWIRNRQQAVTEARASLPDLHGVEVYHYSEVNAITPVLQGNHPRMINAVLPQVPVDLVSYSAYNCMNHTDELPERAWAHFDYILSHASFTGAWKHGRPVFMGEYGLPLPLVPSRPERNLAALKAAASWGSLINLYWSVYTQLPNGNSALIELDNTPNQDYRYLEDYIGKMHLLKHATRVWLGRNPTELEGNALSLGFDTTSPHNILADIINSREFQMLEPDEAFLTRLGTDLALGEAATSQLVSTLQPQLAAGKLTRFSTLLYALDSPACFAAVTDEQFAGYLQSQTMHGATNPSASNPAERQPRSLQFIAALDSDGFRRKTLEFAHDERLTPELMLHFKPQFTKR